MALSHFLASPLGNTSKLLAVYGTTMKALNHPFATISPAAECSGPAGGKSEQSLGGRSLPRMRLG
jgi:hypothetical protein